MVHGSAADSSGASSLELSVEDELELPDDDSISTTPALTNDTGNKVSDSAASAASCKSTNS